MLSCSLSQAAYTDPSRDFYTAHMILVGRKFVVDVTKFCRFLWTYLDNKITWVIEHFHEQSTKIMKQTLKNTSNLEFLFHYYFITSQLHPFFHKCTVHRGIGRLSMPPVCEMFFWKKLLKNLFICSLCNCKLTVGISCA
jgi:hypothetical protein